MSNSEMMHFRATPELADALAKAAEREGVSQSEIIRRAVAGRVGCADEPAPFDAFERIGAAARGELQAQRDLANEAVRMAFDPASGCNPEVALLEGLVFARMAATHGNPADQGLVVSMASLLSTIGGEEAYADVMAEAVARISLVADTGNEEIGDQLPSLVESMPAEVVALAKDYRARLRDTVRGEA